MAERTARRIESEESRTAQFTCIVRAFAYHDPDPLYRCDDWVAARLVPGVIRAGSHIGFVRGLVRRHMAQPGVYEYILGRTKYVDAVFDTRAGDMEQVVILGAGYDSRAIRFADRLAAARVFEVDAPVPQANMQLGLRLRKLTVPPNVVFVPVNFETESAADKLKEAGFQSGRKTLYLAEGLTMYLEPQAIESTFGLIASTAGPGSRLVFDYIHASVLRGEVSRYGEAGLVRRIESFREPWQFGLEDGALAGFLARYGFGVEEEIDGPGLEKRFFTAAGRSPRRVNDTHAIVSAIRR